MEREFGFAEFKALPLEGVEVSERSGKLAAAPRAVVHSQS
jgi:hypothetical protein